MENKMPTSKVSFLKSDEKVKVCAKQVFLGREFHSLAEKVRSLVPTCLATDLYGMVFTIRFQNPCRNR